MASYPSTVVAYTTKRDGDAIFSVHINALQDEVAALEAALLTSGLAHPLQLNQAFRSTGTITPGQITARVDDYNPLGLATAYVVRLTSDADGRVIGGLAAQPGGTLLVLQNVNTSAFGLVLSHQDAGSAAVNRFSCPGAANFTLGRGASVTLWYDITSNGWRVMGTGTGGGGAITDPTPYTPVWTATGTPPVLSNGAITGYSTVAGRTCWFDIRLVWGSTTTSAGSGSWTLTVPFPTSSLGQNYGVFPVWMYDSSAALTYVGMGRWANTGAFLITTAAYPTPSNVSGNTIPFAWAAGDVLAVSGCYQLP